MKTISEAAKLLGVTVLTLRRWDKEGKLQPSIRTPSGHRRYSLDDLSKVRPVTLPSKQIVAYCRVAEPSFHKELETQIHRISTYCTAKGYSFKVISDTGSCIDFLRPGFKELIHSILSGQVKKLIIEHKDLLVGIGFELIDQICKHHDVDIEIIDQTPNDWYHEEVRENLIAIIINFNEKLKGSRFYQGRKSLQNIKKLYAN